MFVAQLNMYVGAGAALILANVLANQSVTHWRLLSSRSMPIFAIGLVLVYIGL